MVPTRIYVAAGICVLLVGVMASVPGVAVADTDAGSAVAVGGDETANVLDADVSKSSGSTDGAAAAERNAIDGVASTLGSGREPGDAVHTSADSLASTGESVPTSADSPTTTLGSVRELGGSVLTGTYSLSEAPAVTGEYTSIVVAAAADPVTSNPDPVTSDSASTPEPAVVAAAPAPAAVEPAAPEIAPVTEPAAPVNTEVAPAMAQATADVPLVDTAPVTTATQPVPYVALVGTCVIARIADVVAAMGYLLKATAGSLTRLQYGLALLFAITGVEPVMDGLAEMGIQLSTAAGASLGSEFPGGPFAVPLSADATKLTPLGAIMAIGAGQALQAAPEPTAFASPTPAKSMSTGVRSFIRDVGQKLLETPSLMALAVAALPGLGGLVLLTVSGVQLGYRQAKADFALRGRGIAHFARMGPIGVVRSESLVSVRLRTQHVQTPESQARAGPSHLKLVC